MKLVAFRIRKFRNIQDSGDVFLSDNLTCIVGKNQSGKTSILKALHKFNPHDKTEKYNIQREWPRGERRKQDPKHAVCEAVFELDKIELDHLAGLSPDTMSTNKVSISKDYSGTFEMRFPGQAGLFPRKLHPHLIDKESEREIALGQPVSDAFKQAAKEVHEEIQRLGREGRFSDLKILKPQHDAKLTGAFSPGNPQPQHQNENAFLAAHRAKLDNITKIITGAPTLHQQAHDYLISKIPVFIYMDDYQEFRGSAFLDQVKARQDAKRPTPEDATFQMILKLSGLETPEADRAGRRKGRSHTARASVGP
jgi:hypothetical protein